jgi:parallel beta-helix repeat protein
VKDNTVNGKPLVYLEDVSDYKVEDAGQVIIVNCNNITIENLDLSNTDVGIVLGKTENSIIANNTVNNNYPEGIYFSGSDNLIYLNNFINNTDNVHSSTYYESTNIWNSTEEITYYNGKYTNYLGNYWDDYTRSDKNNDGIGDTPYNINGDKDYYPLMERYENYV